MRGSPSLWPREAIAAMAAIIAWASCGWGGALAAGAGSGASMAGSVGEMLRLETEKALADTRHRVAAATQAPAPDPRPGAAGSSGVAGTGSASLHADTVELLGTWRRGDARAADLAVNGVVTQVGAGDRLGAYQVKAVATHCVHLLYRQRTEMLRCISGAKP